MPGLARLRRFKMNTLKMTFLTTFLTRDCGQSRWGAGWLRGRVDRPHDPLVVHAINYWFIDKIILRMHGAKKIQPDGLPRLYRTVQDLTCQTQISLLFLQPTKTPHG